MNILISSASAKLSLIEGFRAALSTLKLPGKIIAADSNPDVAAAQFADEFVRQPDDGTDDYVGMWLQICRQHKIDLLVPTRDAELIPLAMLAETLQSIGVRVLVPPPKPLLICLDKIKFYEFCVANNFPVLPRVIHPAASDLPLFLRPRSDAGSKAARAILTEQDLEKLNEEMLLQPLCTAVEFSIDTLFSLDGRPLQAVVRERIEVVNGESVVTRIGDYPQLSDLALRLGVALGLSGPAVVQCFYNEKIGPQLIECNPRFGGASMVSVSAGLASCERILLQLMGRDEQACRQRAIAIGELIDRRLATGVSG